MSFPIGSYAPGKHAYFYRDGDLITVPAAGGGNANGASSRTNKPDATDPLFVDLGAIADWSHDIKGSDEKVWAPSPGRLQLKDIVEKQAEAMFKFTTEEVSALAFEVFYRTSAKLTGAGGQFNPLSAPPRKGWLHVELYDQNNTLVASMDVYGMLRITGGVASKDGSLLKPQWEFNVLYATQNTGILNNA